MVSLESPLELGEALAILVKLGLELTQLHKVRNFVIPRWGPTCPSFPGVLGSSLAAGARPSAAAACVSSVVPGPVDVEALPRRVIAVRFGVGIWHGGVEASAPHLRQLLPERGNGVLPRS